MKQDKKDALQKKGWRFGDADAFLASTFDKALADAVAAREMLGKDLFRTCIVREGPRSYEVSCCPVCKQCGSHAPDCPNA